VPRLCCLLNLLKEENVVLATAPPLNVVHAMVPLANAARAIVVRDEVVRGDVAIS